MITPRKFVEIFVEKDCPSCEQVMGVIHGFSGNPAIELRVYDREKNLEAFQERQVLICPATFVNHRLVFYGAFTLSEFTQYLA
ncbi:MAG: thioredoxin family protein [Bacteroidota bacterium]